MKSTPRTLALAALATSASMVIIFGNLPFTFLGVVQAVAVCTLIERN